MGCSYEQYEEALAPSRFYRAGIPMLPAVALGIPPVAIALTSGWWSARWWHAGGLSLAAAVSLWVLLVRRWSLRYWADRSDPPIRSLRERNVLIGQRRVAALVAFYPPEHGAPLEQVGHDLDPAEKELAERRAGGASAPRRFAAPMLALLGSSLTLLLSQASWKVALLVIGSAALFFCVLSFARVVLDEVFDSRGDRFAGYVALLRQAKRQLSHEMLRKKASGSVLAVSGSEQPATVRS